MHVKYNTKGTCAVRIEFEAAVTATTRALRHL